MKIEMHKEYETKSKRAVRLLCIDGLPEFPIVGIVDGHGLETWTINGECGVNTTSPLDLVPKKKIYVGYVNIYRDKYFEARSSTVIFETEKDALNNHKVGGWIGVGKTEWEE
jgi:hypothetical protein